MLRPADDREGSIAHGRIFESCRSVAILLTSPVEIRDGRFHQILILATISATAAYKVYRPVDH